MPKQTPKERLAQARIAVELKRLDLWGTICNNLIRWGALALMIRWLTQAIIALSGQLTIAQIAVKFAAQVGIGRWLAYALATGAVGYGWRQRKLRRDTVERLTKRVTQLEETLDRKRSSSKLTARGETRPEDKP